MDVKCPKCSAEPGEPCRSIRTGELMRTHGWHKKRQHALLLSLGARSTEPTARTSARVPVPVSASRRVAVGAVDSPLKTLERRLAQ